MATTTLARELGDIRGWLLSIKHRMRTEHRELVHMAERAIAEARRREEMPLLSAQLSDGELLRGLRICWKLIVRNKRAGNGNPNMFDGYLRTLAVVGRKEAERKARNMTQALA